MIKYLKSKQEYIDRYDRFTVENCRQREASFRKIEEDSNLDPAARQLLCKIGLYLDLLNATLQWYEDKDGTIDRWMREDEMKDEMLNMASAPERVRCIRCGGITVLKDKLIYDWGDEENPKVLFMLSCANGCLPHRAIFNDGRELRAKLDICAVCNSELKSSHERVGCKVYTKHECLNCGHTHADEIDLVEPDVKPDLDFPKDRERFCISKEEAERKSEEKWRIKQMNDFMHEMEEKEKRRDLYAAIALLKKLTVIDLEKLLILRCESTGFIKFLFDRPEFSRNFTVSFTVHEGRSERAERQSVKELQEIIQSALENTNWRLMSDGVTYRLGILAGRLRAYEADEDLLKLVELKLKKSLST